MSVIAELGIGFGIGVFVTVVSKPLVTSAISFGGKLIFIYGKKKVYVRKIRDGFKNKNYHRVQKYIYKLEILDGRYDTSFKNDIIKEFNIENNEIFNNKELFLEYCEKFEEVDDNHINSSASTLTLKYDNEVIDNIVKQEDSHSVISFD